MQENDHDRPESNYLSKVIKLANLFWSIHVVYVVPSPNSYECARLGRSSQELGHHLFSKINPSPFLISLPLFCKKTLKNHDDNNRWVLATRYYPKASCLPGSGKNPWNSTSLWS